MPTSATITSAVSRPTRECGLLFSQILRPAVLRLTGHPRWWTRNAIAVVGLASLLTAAFAHVGVGDGLEGGSVAALAIDPKTPTTVYAGTGGGVLKSSDGGQSWAASNTSLTEPGVEALALVPSQPATLYAGTSNGIFKSTKGGESWTGLH